MKGKKTILFFIIIIIIASLSIVVTPIIIQNRGKEALEEMRVEHEIKYRTNDGKYSTLITVSSSDGIETIKYIPENSDKEIVMSCDGKTKVGLDYIAEYGKTYEFKIKENGKEEQIESITIEGAIPVDSFDVFSDFESSGLSLQSYGFSSVDSNLNHRWWQSRFMGGGHEYGTGSWSMVISLDYSKIGAKIRDPKELYTTFSLIGKKGSTSTRVRNSSLF